MKRVREGIKRELNKGESKGNKKEEIHQNHAP